MSVIGNSVRPLVSYAVAVSFALTGFGTSIQAVFGVNMDEIVVTARKREENLQDVPVSVTAFTAADFEDRQIRTVDDIARFTPGLSFATAFGRTNERPVIRGQGNVLAGVQFGVESGTAYFVDGVYYPGDLLSLNLKEVERVEIIRGPQSALFGRNTYAGAINFITRTPSDEVAGSVQLRYGKDDDLELGADVGGSIVDGVLSGGLYVRHYSFDGEYENIVTGQTVGDEQTTSVSGVLNLTPSDNFSIRTRLSIQKDEDGTRAFFLQPAESNNCFPGTRSNASFLITGSSNRDQYYCGEVNRTSDTVALNDGPAVSGQPAPIPGLPDGNINPSSPFLGFAQGALYNPADGIPFSGVERDLLLVSVLAEWDFEGTGHILSFSVGWRDEDKKTGSDSDHSSINYFTGNDTSSLCQFLCASELDTFKDYTMELRLESPQAQRFRWGVGAQLYDQDVKGRGIVFATSGTGSQLDPIDEIRNTVNIAAFGFVEFDILESLEATVELRAFNEDKSLTEIDGGTFVFDDEVSFSEVAPRATVNWAAADNILLFASYAKGYKPGGLNGENGMDVGRPFYAQEEVDAVEFGAKTDWLDGRVVANISLFFNDLTNIQLTTPLASGGTGTLTSIVTNQGNGEVFGVELATSIAITDDLIFGASYALADSEFTDGCDEFQWTLTSGGGLLQDATACTGTNPNGSGNGSIGGNQFPLSSETQISAYVDYSSQIRRGSEMEFFFGSDWTWEDEKPVQVHNQAWVPDASIVNARLGLRGENWSIAFYGRNLTDEDAPSMVSRFLQNPLISGFTGVDTTNIPPGFAISDVSINFPRAFFGDMRRGRNFGLEFTMRFGATHMPPKRRLAIIDSA